MRSPFWVGVRQGTLLAWMIGGPALVMAAFVFAVLGSAQPWARWTLAAVGASGYALARCPSPKTRYACRCGRTLAWGVLPEYCPTCGTWARGEAHRPCRETPAPKQETPR